MSLNEKIHRLITAMEHRQELKQIWLELVEAGSDEQSQARRNHLAEDDVCEGLIVEIRGDLNTARNDGLSEFVLMALDEEATRALHQMLSERGLLNLLEPTKPNSLVEHVQIWRDTSATLDAARQINRLRREYLTSELGSALAACEAELLESDGDESRRFQAW